jgi:hypothetical protein
LLPSSYLCQHISDFLGENTIYENITTKGFHVLLIWSLSVCILVDENSTQGFTFDCSNLINLLIEFGWYQYIYIIDVLKKSCSTFYINNPQDHKIDHFNMKLKTQKVSTSTFVGWWWDLLFDCKLPNLGQDESLRDLMQFKNLSHCLKNHLSKLPWPRCKNQSATETN